MILEKIRYKFNSIRDTYFSHFFAYSPFLSSFYYFFLSSSFRREHHAVLKGKVLHLKELKRNKANIYTLIRNTHRIEKGLLMKPRKDVFALDFIEETIDAFSNVWDPSKCRFKGQDKWFFDVLSEYFRIIGSHPTVEKAERKFKTVLNKVNMGQIHNELPSIPYARLEENKSSITYDEFFKLAKYRRSVRWFLPKKVNREDVDNAILIANQSPSACNRQPFEYRVIDEPELLNKVANLPGGVKGYVEGIPMMVICIGNLDAYFDERDRHVIYIDASLANMSFMLALETLGLSSCAINWPDVEVRERKMETLLKLEKHQRVIMCMAVGYPDPTGMVAYSEKRELNYIRKFNNN